MRSAAEISLQNNKVAKTTSIVVLHRSNNNSINGFGKVQLKIGQFPALAISKIGEFPGYYAI